MEKWASLFCLYSNLLRRSWPSLHLLARMCVTLFVRPSKERPFTKLPLISRGVAQHIKAVRIQTVGEDKSVCPAIRPRRSRIVLLSCGPSTLLAVVFVVTSRIKSLSRQRVPLLSEVLAFRRVVFFSLRVGRGRRSECNLVPSGRCRSCERLYTTGVGRGGTSRTHSGPKGEKKGSEKRRRGQAV